ncbi:RadC family protein [Moheibacter sediminis]|uniref:DNA repair protein RadC n=1 Tax=Moheibacter sediminis TaxID=1434700 RepID=A0A1W1YIP1_9FLAO|nr:DNA repair protein RadC [Moheibacter sediminis]SMC35618.1 DNA repair protein RadC [Moheibacter sediminis]
MNYQPNPIKNWAEDDRPREKLLLKGQRALSDSELLAIIMGSGSRDESAVDLAKRILASVENNWNNLSRLSVKDLRKFKGVGEVKAISIMTALEIGRRRAAQGLLEKPKIDSSQDAFVLLQSLIGDANVEEFWVLYLNQGNFVVRKEQISKGGINQTSVDLRIIMKIALEEMATSMILAHNHPSGNLNPSQADINLTRKIKEAALSLDIEVFDHLIVTQKSYFSFANEGML